MLRARNSSPPDDLAGLGVYETSARLIERYGEKVAIALIGPGAEMKLRSAGIQNVDRDRVPSRIAARGGLGAVMATKGLKAIVFDGASGQKPPILDLEAFRKAQKEYTQALMANPQVGIYKNYGTAGMTRMTQAFGALPTRNFSSGQFEGAEDISGETIARMAAQPGRQFPALPRLHGRLHHPMLECLRRRRRQNDCLPARI